MEIRLNESQFSELLSTINQKANEADRTPTLAQKEAGNYRMGHIRLGGFNITIENPKGSYRTFKNPDGSIGKIQMKHHYGYFTQTLGRDGDAIDVFVGTYLKYDKIYVVDQNNEKGEFDESKVMLGFKSIEDAKAAYLSNFSPDWKGFKRITAVSVDFFKQWLYDGLKQRKPFYQYVDVKQKSLQQLKEWIEEIKTK